MPRKMIFRSKINCRVCGEEFQPKGINIVMCSEVCRNKNRREWESNHIQKLRENTALLLYTAQQMIVGLTIFQSEAAFSWIVR